MGGEVLRGRTAVLSVVLAAFALWLTRRFESKEEE